MIQGFSTSLRFIYLKRCGDNYGFFPDSCIHWWLGPCLVLLWEELCWFSYCSQQVQGPVLWGRDPQADGGGLKATSITEQMRGPGSEADSHKEHRSLLCGVFEQTFICGEVSVPEDTCVWAAGAADGRAAVLIEMLGMQQQHSAVLSWSHSTCVRKLFTGVFLFSSLVFQLLSGLLYWDNFEG